MPLITFKPSGKVIEAPKGSDLVDAARDAGLYIDTPCGGLGTCGKCIVRVVSGSVDSDSIGRLPKDAVAEGYVLACHTKVSNNPITVEIPEKSDKIHGKFTDKIDDNKLIHPELMPGKWDYDPLAVKWAVSVAEPMAEDGMSDLDRLTNAVQKDWGKKDIEYGISVIRSVADAIRAKDGLVTVTIIRKPEGYQIVNVEPGNNTESSYGIAIDVGTTTIAVRLIFLPLGEVVATRSDYNSQIGCGLDVISRINFALRDGGLEDLRTRVLQTINKVTKDVADSHGVKLNDICNAVVSGNTTMVHLMLGLNPEYIRLEPYTPTLLKVPYLIAEQVGMNINSQSWVYFSPNVGSYVGGDITAGVLCTPLATDSEELTLFIDIGTNGEIVIGNNEFMMTCACSAGPAFEGGGLEFGMRASTGAIEKVEVNKETGYIEYSTIGNVKPSGICGSGMISLLAELFRKGLLDPAGKLNREKASKNIIINGRQAKLILVKANETSIGKDITISEVEIENIIRTKAAIYSACALMLEQVEMDFTDLGSVYIAGGFGRYLNLDDSITIGLLPDLPYEKFKFIGNSSLVGANMVLISQEHRRKQIEMAERMTYIELSTDPGYMDQYTAALFLPHTDPSLFPSVKVR